MPDEVPWLLTFMSVPRLAAQLFRSLTESVSLSICFTGLPATFHVANYIKDTDSLYIADGEHWYAEICDGKKLQVLTGEYDEVDDDEDDGKDVEQSPNHPQGVLCPPCTARLQSAKG